MIQKKDKMKDIEAIFKKYFCFLFILVFFLLHLSLSAYFPLTPDEAYYWLWSHSLQAGYPDHPPMVAYWIKTGTILFGDTPFAIRFSAVCAVSLTTIFLWKASTNLFGENIGKWSIYLFTCTLFSNVIALIITPDTPAILFLSTALWITSYLLKIDPEEKSKFLRLSLLLGLFSGLSFLSKYTAILSIFGIYLAFFLKRPDHFFKKEIYFSFIPFLLVIIPNILWNAQNQGAAFAKQGHRFFIREGGIGAHYLELLGGQVGLLTPIIFLLLLKVFFQKTERQKEKEFLIYTVLPGILFFLLYPLHARVQANWPFVIWPFCIAMGGLASRAWKVSGCIVGIICIATVYAQALFHIAPLNAHYDPTLRQSGGWDEMARCLEKKLPSGTIIEAPDYAFGAMLAYALRNSTLKVGSRDKKFQLLKENREITVNVRSIQEIRGNFRPENTERICRYQRSYRNLNEIRCYALGKEQTKKISLLF